MFYVIRMKIDYTISLEFPYKYARKNQINIKIKIV